jgi:sn-glycerol 3-phosphate transport system substrate-binding protein
MRRTRPRGGPLAVALLALTALVAAACGGGDGDEGAGGGGGGGGDVACPYEALEGADGPVEITAWHNYTALGKRTFEALVEEYNASQDKVRVTSQPQGVSFEETLRKYKLASEDDKLPNLALLEDTTTQVIADSGTIIPGQACYDADPDAEAIYEDFLPIAVASYEVDGELQPVGFDVYTALVYYNRTHFTEAGLDPAVPAATLADIRTQAETLKAARGAGNPDYVPVSVVAASWQAEWWLTGVDQPIVDEDNGRDGLATSSEFASDATTELMEFWRGMVADGLAKPFAWTEGQVNHLFSMATESASIVVESSAGVNTIAGLLTGTVDPEELEQLGLGGPGVDPSTVNLDLDLWVGPFPGIDEPGQGQIGGGAWYLTNGGDEVQQAAAWDFMKWLNSTPQQVRWALEGSGVPVVQSAVEDPALQEKWDTTLGGQWTEIAFGVLENVDTDFPGPLIGPYKETREAIRGAYERVLLGDGNVQAAIDEADGRITEAVQDYRETVGG